MVYKSSLFDEDDFESEDVVKEVALSFQGKSFDRSVDHATQSEAQLVLGDLDREVANSLRVGSFEGIGDPQDGGELGDPDTIGSGEVAIDEVVSPGGGLPVIPGQE